MRMRKAKRNFDQDLSIVQDTSISGQGSLATAVYLQVDRLKRFVTDSITVQFLDGNYGMH